jgi:hypothetical protein
LDVKTLETTLSVLLKHESDLQRARRWLQRPSQSSGPGDADDSRLARWRN